MEHPPLRVLHLVRSLQVGGLERMVVDLTQGLQSRGVESFLGCLLDPGAWAGRAGVEGQWCGRLAERSPSTVLWDLCCYVRRQRVDLIHTHNSHPHKYGAAASLLTGVPLVHTKHGRNWPDNPRWVWLSRQLSRLTRFIVPVSADIERIVVEIEKVPPRKVVRIVNGVETDHGTPTPMIPPPSTLHPPPSTRPRSILSLPPGALVIGSVGRFSPEKQYPWLVRVFARVLAECPDAALLLVGDGPERGAIEAAVSQCRLEGRVVLPGMQENVREWLQGMDVFCLSSDQEGTSVTLLEAGAAGLPAAVTDVGGNGEIVQNEETGLVVPFGDDAAMSGALVRLARDAGLRARMGAAACKRVEERYSLDAMVDQYVGVYHRAMGGG